ncbi:MAG: PD40 domain-containing protein, partial [Gemmatimonadota bacterium]|nr:PD40 domain-containing protein [Gemmatimonadota bacterium]
VFRQSQLNVALSPDGKVLVFAALGGDGTQRLYARGMDALNARPLSGTEGGEQPFFSPDGQSVAFWVAGRLLQVGLAGGTPQRIADLPNMTGATWTKRGIIVASVDNRLVWFRANDAAKQHTAPLDAASQEDLQYYPVALPDGDHIVYASWAGGGLETVHLAVLSLSSGKVHRTATPGLGAVGMLDGMLVYGTSGAELVAAPFDTKAEALAGPGRPVLTDVAQGNRGVELAALSHTGTLVYATGTGQSALVLADSAGETPLVPGAREYSFPRYSPDGQRLAVSISTGATRDVWLYDFATKGLRRLTSGGTVNERPEWTPDGTRVLFRSDRGPRSAIWWQPVDASAPPSALQADPRAAYYEGIISSDGRTLVYQVDTSTADLYYRALRGDTTPHAAVSDAAQDFEGRLSPDGRWLAYQTDQSGTMQVVVQEFPGPGPRIPISTDGGTEPVWSRDGRRLFYRGSGQFVVVTVSTTPSFHVVSRANFMADRYVSAPAPHANYDVSPDGKRLLVLKGDAQRLVVVHDWWSEVRRRAMGDTTR